MIDIVERLRFDAIRCDAQFSKGVAGNVSEAADEIGRLREALRAFAVHATYPVSTKINPRGYAWRGEEALDYAKSLADAALALWAINAVTSCAATSTTRSPRPQR